MGASGPIRKGRPAPQQYVVQPGGDGPQDERHATVEPHATEDVGREVHSHFEPRHADDDGPDPAHERCHDAGTFVPERGQEKHRRDGRGDHQAREKAAVLLESLVGNHALVDGNKRIGWLAIVVFYGLNGIKLEAHDDDAYDLVIGVASSTTPYHEAATLLATWHEPPPR